MLVSVEAEIIQTNRGLFNGRSIISNIGRCSLIRTENDVVKPLKPLFYKRYVDDIYSRRKKNCADLLYHELNNYHPNINLTIEINPKNFLDTQVVIKKKKKKETAIYRNGTKLPVPWSSNIPKQYKPNAINADLYHSKRISTNFNKEIYRVKKKQIIHKNLLKVSSVTLKMIK